MAWISLNYSNKQIRKAGDVLAGRDNKITYNDAMEIMNNWRSFHSFPLNAIQMNLRQMSRKYSTTALISQRLKRVESIINKLKIFPNMPLSSMQDIAGCRSVLENMSELKMLTQFYLTKTGTYHKLSKTNDYIQFPKESGYRSFHLVYEYKSKFAKYNIYNGVLVEIQIRTKIQHAWATAVETAGMFLKTALKSNQGPDSWIRFFRLAGSLFAVSENNPIDPNLGSVESIKKEIIDIEKKLNAISRLGLYNHSVKILESKRKTKEKYFILALNTSTNELQITSYTSDQISRATEQYLILEKEQKPDMDIVLVSSESIEMLKKAYPNYFTDTTNFVSLYNRILA